MTDMHWAYIAGFFDGEGCITRKRDLIGRIGISQAGEHGRGVLEEIGRALTLASIPFSVQSVKQKPPWLVRNELCITSIRAAYLFLGLVLPWLIVKKTRAQDTVRFLKLFYGRQIGPGHQHELPAALPTAGSNCDDPWAYVAGLFDAEGHLRTGAAGSSVLRPGRIDIGQSGADGHAALLKVCEFLRTQGMNARVYTVGMGRKAKKPAYRLYVFSRRDVTEFLRRTVPYLRVKKVVAQDTLRYLTIFPQPRTWRSRWVSTEEILRLRKQGLTGTAIAARLGCEQSTVYYRLAKVDKVR